MKYAIISDIHSNLNALKLVLADIKQFNVDTIYNLGDIVGYGNQPAEVIKLLKNSGVKSVIGNHDYTTVYSKFPFEYTIAAQMQIEDNRDKLFEEDLEYLGSLPDFISENNMRMVHGLPPDDINVYIHTCTTPQLSTLFRLFDEDIAFVGHTHRFGIYKQASLGVEVISFVNNVYDLNHKRAIINIGSVGLPRDGDKRPGYVIYDQAKSQVIKRRVSLK